MPSKRLFVFGYETPAEARSNSVDGTDFESSTSLWITSASEEDALDWGCAVAQQFVTWLFERAGEDAYFWGAAQFAHWIEADPNVLKAAAKLPIVTIGEMPDFTALAGDP